jgi:glycerophosphoryl diester phosphodiesterase
MNTIKLNTAGTNVQMIAHRGLSGLEAENTCAAFVAAGNRDKYFGIETDIHRTLDGKFVIFHDDNTKRMATDSMIVEETTFQTLRSLRLVEPRNNNSARGDLIMPTLEEYISICARYEKYAVLELKNEFTASDVYKIMGIIDKMGYLDKNIVISFCLKNLIRLRKRYPKVQAQFLLSVWDDKHMDSLVKYDLDLDIKYTAVTAELCQKIHDAGKVINTWTVDTVEEGQRVMECGVDFITTNILE